MASAVRQNVLHSYVAEDIESIPAVVASDASDPVSQQWEQDLLLLHPAGSVAWLTWKSVHWAELAQCRQQLVDSNGGWVRAWVVVKGEIVCRYVQFTVCVFTVLTTLSCIDYTSAVGCSPQRRSVLQSLPFVSRSYRYSLFASLSTLLYLVGVGYDHIVPPREA